MVFFTLSCGAGAQVVLRFFSESIDPYTTVYLLCLWEEVSSGSSHATILNPFIVFIMWLVVEILLVTDILS